MNMLRKITRFTGILLLGAALLACSSPEEKAADYIAGGNARFDAGEYLKAEVEYKNALQINQNLSDAWYGLARIHERRQEWRKAYAVLNKIRELDPSHVDGRIMLGQLLLASNQIDQALNDATEILQMAPNDAHAHALMAAVQLRLENYDEAKSEIEKTIALDPKSNEAILVRARLLMAQDNFSSAITLLDEAIESDSKNVSLYLMKIQAYQQQGNEDAIEAVYQRLVGVFPENSAFKHALANLYLQQEKLDKAEQMLEQIVASEPYSVDDRLGLVDFKNQYRSRNDAVNLLKTYINTNPGDYRYHFRLGELYEQDQQQAKALELYRNIVESEGITPNGIEARNRIALMETRAGKFEDAKALIAEVLSQDKNNENALLLRAGFQINERQFDDAVVVLRTVLRDNPNSIKALGLLGQAYDGTGSSELAIESYTKAYNLSPSIPVITNQLASHFIRQRNYLQADEIIEGSIRKGNRNLDSLKLLAQVKLVLGEWEQAEKLSQALSKVKGQEAISNQMLGLVYLGRQQPEEGLAAFKRAHELAPEAAQPVVALVQTYIRNGNSPEARKFLNSILSTNPKNVLAHRMLGQISLMEQKIPEAITHYSKVIEIAPDSDIGYVRLASIYMRMGDLDKAEQTIKRGMSTIENQTTLKITMASLYENRQQFDDAIAIYESLLEKTPDLLVAKNNLASLLTDHREDQATLDRARNMSNIFKDSGIPQFRDTYAWAAVRSGINLEEAIVILKGIVDDNDAFGIYKYHLGEAYRKKGDTENAIVVLKQAAEQVTPGTGIADKIGAALEQID